MRAAKIAGLTLLLAVPAAGQTTIDSFTTNQALLSAPPQASSNAGGAGILGTNRGVVVNNLAGAGPTTAQVTGGNLVLTVTATTPDSRGEARLTWDGDTNPLVLSPTGLGALNFTTGNSGGLAIGFVSSTVTAEIEITVYSTAANFSRAARRVASGGAQTVRIPFTEFRIAGGTGASFTSVGAVELTVRSGEGTFSITDFVTSPPVLAATKVDAQTVDNDSDTRVDPGDRVRYTVTITNTGNQAATVDLSDTVDVNTAIVADSTSATPIARNDQYGWFGNVTMTADGTPHALLLANDSDPDGDDVDVQSVVSPTAAGGTVVLDDAETGAFTYTPPAGFKGVDSFNYTIVDDNSNVSTATANVQLEGVVWFVDDSNTTPPHLGTLTDPFQTLASVNGTDPDGPGDTIFLYDDDGTPYAGGHTMEADQRFIGQRVGLVLGGETIVAAGGTPQITNAAGRGINLALNNTIQGLDVVNTSQDGIAGASFGTLNASSINVTGAGGTSLLLSNGTLAAAFDAVSSTGVLGNTGLELATVGGTLTIASTTLTNPATAGILVTNSPTLTADFGTTTITDNAIGSGATAAGIDLDTGNSGASFSFGSTSIVTDGGPGIVAANITILLPAALPHSIVATGGAAIDLTAVSHPTALVFTTLSSTNSTGKGVNIDSDTSPSQILASGGSITNPAGVAFDVNAGSASITYAGSISNTANARLIEVTNRTGSGQVNFSGTLSSTLAGNGILVQNNTSGSPTINFSGASKTFNTGADPAVTLDNNDNATINFTGGGLDIDTTSGVGFNAINGATAITVQGTGNTINSGTGTALNVVSTAIGGSHITFEGISSNGASSGIILNASGAGGLKVTGNSSGNCGGTITLNAPGALSTVGAPVVADCTGGTIQNSTGVGISLTNTDNVALTRMRVLNSGTDGILISDVNNFTLANSFISDSSGVAQDRGIEMGDFSTGTPVNGAISVTNSTLGPTPHDNFAVGISSGTSTWNITSTVFNDSQLNSGFNFEIRNATVSSFLMDGCVLRSQFADGMQMQPASGVNATLSNVTIQNSKFESNNIGIDLNHDGTSNVTYRVLNNTFLNQVSNSVNFFSSAVQAPTTGGTINGRFVGNFIGDPAVFNSGGGIGIRININGGADATVLVDSNTIRQIPNGRGIEIISRNGTGGCDATVTNNFVNTDFVPTVPNGGFSLSNIFLQSNALTVANTLRSDVRSNTVPATPPNGELVAGQLVVIRSSTSTNQLVDNPPASADAAAELASHNTGSTAVSGTVTLIPGPINTPP